MQKFPYNAFTARKYKRTNVNFEPCQSYSLHLQIVGLGNFDMPQTRHSVGMQVVDKLANCLHTCFHREKECAGCVATASLNGLDLVLLKPKMPMNVNGTSVRKTGKLLIVVRLKSCILKQ